MKCATFHNGKITKGIQTTKSNGKKVPIVFLGQRGSGGIPSIVFLNWKNGNRPKLDDNNIMFDARVEKIPAKYKDRKTGEIVEVENVVLSGTREKGMECIVRVNTSTQLVEKKRINGRIRDIKGWPQQISHGRGFSNRQKFVDELWVVDDMDALLIISSGGGRDHRFVIYNDKGDLICTPELEYLKQEKKREIERSKNIAVTTVISDTEEPETLPGNEMTSEEKRENLSLNELDEAKPTSDFVDETMSDAEIRDEVIPMNNTIMGDGPIYGVGENPTTSEESSALIEEVASEDKETVIHDRVDEEVIAAV